MTRWAEWVDGELTRLHAAGRWRAIRDFDALGPVGTLEVDGETRRVVSFASNDYLGLSHHPDVVAAAHDALDRWGAGAGAARLIVGSRPVHTQLEADLADWKGCEAALVFPTGFAANIGVLSAFGVAGSCIFSDELNHASIVDGARLSHAEVVVYPHRDLRALDTALAATTATRAIVVTDSVFSMDGDVAPLDDIAEVCTRHRALLVIDEAHAVLGPDAPSAGDVDGLDVLRVGTLSKTLGALGGFVAGPRPFVDYLVNRARPFIFTTAPTPADAAAARAALRVLRSPEGARRVAHLRALVDRLRPGHPSPIVPVVLGDESTALAASAALLAHGFLVPAIRPPTVAPGTCRLRVALSADHTFGDVDELAGALASITDAVGAPA